MVYKCFEINRLSIYLSCHHEDPISTMDQDPHNTRRPMDVHFWSRLGTDVHGPILDVQWTSRICPAIKVH